jgi:eukaryotic-like serine/threonine-protein kinase
MSSHTIGGRYRVLRELGRGAMGVVYEVEDVRHGGERLALKLMLQGEGRPDLIERFRREARAMESIASEHVVRITDSGLATELNDKPFMVMELLNGVHLGDYLTQHGPLTVKDTCEILRQAANALDRAHAAGIVHRDLKPANLFLHHTADGRRVVKVLDFGIAALLDDDMTPITPTGEAVGTLQYMAPEQTHAQKKGIGPRADVWAIGMIAYELLTGEKYWHGDKPSVLLKQLMSAALDPPSTLHPKLPAGFDDWFFGSCARDVNKRFPKVGDQITVLEVIMRKQLR